MSDKVQAWDDLHRLTSDKGNFALWWAIYILERAFEKAPDEKQMWEDLMWHTSDVPDKEKALKDMHQFTSYTHSSVREAAANAIGSAFAHVPDEKKAWDDLHRLTYDTDRDVRIAANHSSGKVCIFRAGEAENENVFRKEMENALGFFEKASKEATYFNPAKFCLPFYRSFFAITFKKEEAEVQKYLTEAKKAVEGSESKEKLLEAVENLGNALKKAQKARYFTDLKSDLNAYRRYCDRACELLDTTEDKAPGASRLIRKGLPIIDEKIKEILGKSNQRLKASANRRKVLSLKL